MNINGISKLSTSHHLAQSSAELESAISEGSIISHNKISLTPDAPSAQALESVNLVVDKLRARDMTVYPDFQSLMTSAEISELSPAAMDKIMAEVSRMFEDGELDPSFFPGQ